MPTFRLFAASLALAAVAATAEPVPPVGRTQPLFDGRTLTGWQGNSALWRVEEGALTGGSLKQTVKENDFLATTRDFTNFIVRFQIKLTGTEGFINSGFQIRSQRVPKSPEMAGYQCDFGDPNWWGAIYDEARRNKVMSASDMQALGPVIRRQDWNEYVIRADGPRITTWINGVQGTDYFENDPAIPDWGKLGIQVHGGGKALVQVRNISIEELPVTPPEKRFIGAPTPAKSANAEPVSPAEERARFTLPPGFEIELVASEADGIGKFVAIDWDTRGRLWTMTALEYPVDANESPAAARELYARQAKDKVLVFDRDDKSSTGYSAQPRVFAEGLAIPLGILPWQNGVYVQHGPDIVFLSDNDGDGRSDRRDVILSGFGVQDSHLFPHQFTRAPGNWIWMAQGAFNYGKVKTRKGAEVQFDQTRMARFRHDGSEFEITSQGPCNIWGLAMTMEGETWIQEANDYGYPAMPFHEYANYPGCSDAQMKSYAPEFPGTAPDFRMGGTGLSGLAFSDKSAWPEPYADVLYVANPITRKIQAIKPHRDGPRYRLQKLPDFIQSSDEMFRPVALRTGPDGCLYIVDWYNKIISHNEVPRTHPERDKKRGRIWRVKHRSQTPFAVPDFTALNGEELIARLGGESLTQSHLAWQAIIDRRLTNLAPALRRIVADRAQPAGRRIAALWALGGIAAPDAPLLRPMLGDANRNIRREAIRAIGSIPAATISAWEPWIDLLKAAAADGDPEVRAEVIKTTAGALPALAADRGGDRLIQERMLPLLVSMAKEPLAGPTARSTQNGSRTIKVREAYEREFERYLVRLFLERHGAAVAAFLDSERARSLPAENRLVATLSLDPKTSARRVATLLSQITRPPGSEEMLRLAQFPAEPGVAAAIKSVLADPAARKPALEALLNVRTRFDAAPLAPILSEAAQSLWGSDDAGRELAVRMVSAFKLRAFESQLAATAGRADAPMPSRALALRALRDLGSTETEPIAAIARTTPALREDALAALAASRHERAPALLLDLWPELSFSQRRSALSSLSGSKNGASAIVKAVQGGQLAHADLDSAALDRLQTVLRGEPELASLLSGLGSALKPVARFGGKPGSYLATRLKLEGPFTVECWLKLDPGINNQDGILGAPGQLDMNFHDARFRVWVSGQHDIVVAKRKTLADAWTHYAVTRDEQGLFRIYINGELDASSSARNTNAFAGLDVGRTIPVNGAMAGWMTEFRVWNRALNEQQIRADFDRSFSDLETAPGGSDPAAPGLVQLYTGSNWPALRGEVRVQKITDAPLLLTSAEAREQSARFERFRALAERPGDRGRGEALFATLCMSCHSAGGQGGQIGPILSGAGAAGIDSLLRNLLTPNAAMEAGYRIFRVETKDGDVVDGILVSQDDSAVVLRRPNVEDTRIPVKEVRRAGFINRSMMPEGLLDPLKPEEVSDLFAFLKRLN